MANNIGTMNVELGLGFAKFQSDMGKATQVARQESQKLAVTMKQQSAAAKDSLDLLGDSIGVRLPREMKKFISQTTLIGPALGAAFKFSVLAAGVAILAEYSGKIAELASELGGFTKAMEDADKAEHEFNQKLLVTFKTIKDGRRYIAETNKEIAANAMLAEIASSANTSWKDSFAALIAGPSSLGSFIALQMSGRTAQNDNLSLGQLLNKQLGHQTELIKKGADEWKKYAFVLRDNAKAVKEFASAFDIIPPTLRTLHEQINSLPFPKMKSNQMDIAAPDLSKLDALIKLQERGKVITEQTRTASEQYKTQIAELNELLARGAIDQDTYNRAVHKLKMELTPMGQIITTIGENFERVFEGIVLGTRRVSDAFKGMAQSIVASIAQVIAKMIAMWIVGKLIGMFSEALGLGTATNIGAGPTGGPGSIGAGRRTGIGIGSAANFSSDFATFAPSSASRGDSTVINIDARGGEAGIENKIYRVVRQAMQETQNNTIIAQREMSLRRA